VAAVYATNRLRVIGTVLAPIRDRQWPDSSCYCGPRGRRIRRNFKLSVPNAGRPDAARLGCFGKDRQFLIHRPASPALDLREDFDSINTARHSRITRRTPSASLCSYVRLKWGPLQDERFRVLEVPPSCPLRRELPLGRYYPLRLLIRLTGLLTSSVSLPPIRAGVESSDDVAQGRDGKP
jgi:hypothetical protein